MFAIIKNNQIAMMVADGTAFEYDDVQYPQNWTNLSTPEEKAAIGMVDVVYAERPSDMYYWVSQDAPVYADGVVTIGYTATPKDLAVLQASAVTEVNRAAWTILQPTDWMVVKSTETGTPVAPEWAEWRAEIRNQAKDQVTAINACTTVDELAALPQVDWAKDPNYVAP